MRSGKYNNPAFIEDVMQLRAVGKTRAEIALAVQAGQKTVEAAIHFAKKNGDPRAVALVSRRNQTTAERENRLLCAYMDGVPLAVIGKQFGMSRDAVMSIIKRARAAGDSRASKEVAAARHAKAMAVFAEAKAARVRAAAEAKQARALMKRAAAQPKPKGRPAKVKPPVVKAVSPRVAKDQRIGNMLVLYFARRPNATLQELAEACGTGVRTLVRCAAAVGFVVPEPKPRHRRIISCLGCDKTIESEGAHNWMCRPCQLSASHGAEAAVHARITIAGARA